MDLLSDILGAMKLTGTLYFRTEFTAPWGVAVPQFENVARFHYVHRGRCFARVEGVADPVKLDQGDLVIITRGSAHILSDPVHVEAVTVEQIVQQSGFDGRGALVYGGDRLGHETQLICGHIAFDPGASHVLLDALPAHLHIENYGKVSPDWLHETLKIIGAELGHDRLGGDLIARHLSEIIFTQAIRHYLASDGQARRGIAGFSDSHIGRALAAIHADPARQWSVEELARTAALSRTGFSNKFSELVGTTPLGYLTDWRMQIARRLLLETDLPIIDVAERSGYQSEASFGRVFKRHFETPPAMFRRTGLQAGTVQ